MAKPCEHDEKRRVVTCQRSTVRQIQEAAVAEPSEHDALADAVVLPAPATDVRSHTLFPRKPSSTSIFFFSFGTPSICCTCVFVGIVGIFHKKRPWCTADAGAAARAGDRGTQTVRFSREGLPRSSSL